MSDFVSLCLVFPCPYLVFLSSLVPVCVWLLLTCFPWLRSVFISPEFPLSLGPFTRQCSCVSCVLSLKSHYSSYLSSPASFPLHDRDRWTDLKEDRITDPNQSSSMAMEFAAGVLALIRHGRPSPRIRNGHPSLRIRHGSPRSLLHHWPGAGSLICGVRRGILRACRGDGAPRRGNPPSVSARGQLPLPYGSPRYHSIVLERGDLRCLGSFQSRVETSPLVSPLAPPSSSSSPLVPSSSSSPPLVPSSSSSSPLVLSTSSSSQLVSASRAPPRFSASRAPPRLSASRAPPRLSASRAPSSACSQTAPSSTCSQRAPSSAYSQTAPSSAYSQTAPSSTCSQTAPSSACSQTAPSSACSQTAPSEPTPEPALF